MFGSDAVELPGYAADNLTKVRENYVAAGAAPEHHRYAQLARSIGSYAEGPITDPKALRAALLRAVARVEQGEVALLDTRAQPR